MKTQFKSAFALSVLLCAVVAHAEVVKIGVAAPLTGAQALFGKDNEREIDDLNASNLKINGQTVKFELVSEDDQADPKTGMAIAQNRILA